VVLKPNRDSVSGNGTSLVRKGSAVECKGENRARDKGKWGRRGKEAINGQSVKSR